MRCSVCRTKPITIQIEYIAPKKNKKSLVATALRTPTVPACVLARGLAAEPPGPPADALDLGL